MNNHSLSAGTWNRPAASVFVRNTYLRRQRSPGGRIDYLSTRPGGVATCQVSTLTCASAMGEPDVISTTIARSARCTTTRAGHAEHMSASRTVKRHTQR